VRIELGAVLGNSQVELERGEEDKTMILVVEAVEVPHKSYLEVDRSLVWVG
jgi:hypothetical protein